MAEKSEPTAKEKLATTYAGFKLFMYNKETGEIMGRTSESWGTLQLLATRE